MNRLVRRLAAVFTIAALVFSQLAVAAFACPLDAPAQPAGVAPQHDDCDEAATSNLCERHCDYGSASVGHVDLSAVAVLPCAGTGYRLKAAPVIGIARAALARRNLDPHPPPPLALFGALRI